MIPINIREIARLCGVSVATVSRTINTPELVQAETRERILRTMQSENYTPTRRSALTANGVASHMLLFLFDAEDYSFYEPAFSGFETVVHPRGYTVLFCPVSAEPQRRTLQMEMLSRQKPAGAIWALRDFHPDDAALFSGKGIPLVLARKYDQFTTNHPYCYVDFTVGSFRMTQHLLSLGRRQIALLVEN
ncbi:MAG: LacI family DNA-binding transcriptional regulator, partial [Candidatus Aphodomorpha sp.]